MIKKCGIIKWIMTTMRESLKEIAKKEHGVLWLMVLLGLSAIVLLIYSLLSLNVSSSVVKVGYGDIGRYQGGEWSSMANSGGYQDGNWIAMLAYPILAVILGVLHNLLAVKLYGKRGAGLTKVFLATSIGLVVGTFIVLARLSGKG